MRLNWNNIGRGLSDVAGAIKEKRLKDDLRAINDAKVEEIDSQPVPSDQAGVEPAVYAPTEMAAGAPAESGNPAAAQGFGKRYKMFDVESETPFTQEQIDDIRTNRVADVYAKHGLTERSMAIKKHLSDTQRQRTRDAQADEEFSWKKKDRAAAEATAARESAVRAGISKTWTDRAAADDASQDSANYQRDMVRVVEGKGLDKSIREAAGPDATQDEIDAAIAAYRGSLDSAVSQHNAAGMAAMYKKQAEIFGSIGGDPKRAAEALKIAEAEGVPKLIEALKAGKVDEANKLWNSTGHTRGIIKSVGQDSKSGDTFAVVIDPYSGQKIGQNGFVNISAIERAMMSAGDVAKLRETESKIDENKAQASSARANAAESGAKVRQINMETENLKAGRNKDGKSDYKVEANEVAAALGTPAVDERGRPITDDYGMQKFTRNPAAEKQFYAWMKKSGIKDTNEALARWKAGDGQEAPAAPTRPAPNKPFDPRAFMR